MLGKNKKYNIEIIKLKIKKEVKNIKIHIIGIIWGIKKY